MSSPPSSTRPFCLRRLLAFLSLSALASAVPSPQGTNAPVVPSSTPTYAPSASASTLAPQPTRTGTPGTFQITGNSGVSAQQMFLGTLNKVYILDKTEFTPNLQINGWPAWGAEYAVDTDTTRAMFVLSNTFCAAGNVMGNGSWVNFGGNQAVTWGGVTATAQSGGGAYDAYNDWDGGQGVRLLDPCDDESCNWIDLTPMTTRRWYPTIETLEDGTLIVFGGDEWGGYVNSADQNNPTYEFFPSQGGPVGLNILNDTLPANLFPLVWLLPSGNMLIQSNWAAEIFDYKNNVEYPLPNIPNAVRVYPASGATAMLPLTPANNWTATIIFCGGTNLEPDQWPDQSGGTTWNIAAYPADDSCVKISPDISNTWEYDDSLPEGRSMGQFIILPNAKLFLLNGANLGTAGYGNDTWAIGHSYADSPVQAPLMYDPAAPAFQRFSRAGLSNSTVPRMYHSSATLLPDGSVFVSGSNPNPDYDISVKYPTEYRTEHFYPEYYNSPRPEPSGVPDSLTYGGDYFNITLAANDPALSTSSIANTTAVVIRPGFSTHAMNFGQRYVELATSYTGNQDGSGVLHVSQLPPNPAIIVPGPALFFVVVNGVPSVGQMIMLGNGELGDQPISDAAVLPESSLYVAPSNNSDSTSPTGAPFAPSPTSGALPMLANAVGPYTIALLSGVLAVFALAL